MYFHGGEFLSYLTIIMNLGGALFLICMLIYSILNPKEINDND